MNSSRPRKRQGKSKAPSYRGNGKFSLHFGGTTKPTFQRTLTDDERLIEAHLHSTYGEYLGEFEMVAGTNLKRAIWMIIFADGMALESYVGAHELEYEIKNILKRNNVEVI